METPTTRVQQVLSDLAAGRSAVLTGSPIGDPDGYLLLAAENASSSTVAFFVRHSSGFVCAAVTGQDCERLGLPPMAGTVADPAGGYYTVSVDAVDAMGTGISATDRARTLQQLAAASATITQFTRPGHVVPRRAHDLGVFGFRGPAETVTDLTRAAGLHPVGVFAALVSPCDPTRMASVEECRAVAAKHRLNWVSADDVALYRRVLELDVRTTFMTTRSGPFGDLRASGFRSDVSGTDYVAYRIGRPDIADTPLVHVHQESDFAPHVTSVDSDLHAQFGRIAVHGDGVMIVERRTSNVDAYTHPCTERLDAAANRAADVAQVLRGLGVTTPLLLDPPDDLQAALESLGVHATVMPSDAADSARHETTTETTTPNRTVQGVVTHGDQRGRELGFATANLEIDDSTYDSWLSDGVWAGRCVLPDSRVIPAAVSIGRRSTFYGRVGPRLLEAHLLDFNEDLYDDEVTVHLDHWIRRQVTFSSKEELIAALEDDVRRTRAIGVEHSPIAD